MHARHRGTFWEYRFCVLVGSLLATLATAEARAQDLCFPTPVALPGLGGPPDWEAPGTVRTELNEPRWAAAPQTGFQSDPTDAEGLFRVMVDAARTQLIVSFQAPTDPGTPSNADAIYFGFTTDGATGTLAKGIRINVPAAGTDPIAATSVQQFNYDAGGTPTWTTPIGAPAWLVEPAAWISDATAAWGVNFRVDLVAAGLGTASPFKIMLAMHKRDESDPTPPFDGVDVWTPDPGPQPLLAGTLLIENPANWANAAAIDTACPDGITISGSQIGTRNMDGANPAPSKINTTDGAVNSFYAQPTFPPSMPVFAGLIQGRFHVANWGSIAAVDAPWNLIPNGDAVPNGAAPAPNDQTLEFACPANAGGMTCGLPTPSEDHQCVYVELRAAPGQTVTFTRAAAYRNMQFQALSEFEAPAEISVEGLKQVFGNDEPRDVYLYVYPRNMEPHQDDPMWLPTDTMAATRRFAEVPPRFVKRPGRREAVGPAPGKPRELPLPNTGVGDLDLNAHQALSAVWPTYDVHVYYDTGKVIHLAGTDTTQLAPMFPFTYFYSHEGPLYGFSHALEGLEGAEVKELRPNVFLVRVPSEGSVKISTQAVAHEKRKTPIAPPQACPECPPVEPPARGICNCSVPGGSRGPALAWALLGVSLLGLALRLRARRRRTG